MNVLAWASQFCVDRTAPDVYERLHAVLVFWRKKLGIFIDTTCGDERKALRKMFERGEMLGVSHAMPTSPMTLMGWRRWTTCPRRKEALAVALDLCGIANSEHSYYQKALQILSLLNLNAAIAMRSEAQGELENMIRHPEGRTHLSSPTCMLVRASEPLGFRLHTVMDEPEQPQLVRSDMVGIVLESELF